MREEGGNGKRFVEDECVCRYMFSGEQETRERYMDGGVSGGVDVSF